MYTKMCDTTAGHPKFGALAELALATDGAKAWRGHDADDITAQIHGAHSALLAVASRYRTGGFLTPTMLASVPWVKPRLRDAMCRPALGRSPLMHREGDTCRCLRDRPWMPGAVLLIHDYLNYNPSAEQYDRHTKRRKQLDDLALRLAVQVRDRMHCRYCGRSMKFMTRKGDGKLQYFALEHVDPNAAESIDDVVAACQKCNAEKGNRTPADAGMRLIPLAEMWQRFGSFRDWTPDETQEQGVKHANFIAGNATQLAGWKLQYLGQISDPTSDQINAQINHGSTDQIRNPSTDPGSDLKPDPEPGTDTDPGQRSHRRPAGQTRHQTGEVSPDWTGRENAADRRQRAPTTRACRWCGDQPAGANDFCTPTCTQEYMDWERPSQRGDQQP